MTTKLITIKRAVRGEDHPYFPTARKAAQNANLSYEASGMLWFLLSKPDDWKVIPATLERESARRGKVYKILNELIEAGYVVRVYNRDIKGKVTDVEYIVHEDPFLENPEMGNQEMGNPYMGKPHNTEYRKGEYTDKDIKDSAPIKTQMDDKPAAASFSPLGEKAMEEPSQVISSAEAVVETKFQQNDLERIIQHYEALKGKSADDALRARITELLRDYDADWIVDAITQVHAAPDPKPRVGDLLAARKAAETAPSSEPDSPPEQKPEDWYDHPALLKAVQEVFNVRGSQEGYIACMLRGTAKGKRGRKSEWEECNLPPDKRMTAESLRDWAAYWHEQNPNLTIVKIAAKIQSEILLWWEAGCPKASLAPVPTTASKGFESHKRPGPEKYQITEEARLMAAFASETGGDCEPETA